MEVEITPTLQLSITLMSPKVCRFLTHLFYLCASFRYFPGKGANYFSAFGAVNISFLPHFILTAMRFMNSVIPLAAYSIFYTLFHRSISTASSSVHPGYPRSHPVHFTTPWGFPGLIRLCGYTKKNPFQ